MHMHNDILVYMYIVVVIPEYAHGQREKYVNLKKVSLSLSKRAHFFF